MSSKSYEEKLAELEEKLAQKFPHRHPKAIKNIAVTLLQYDHQEQEEDDDDSPKAPPKAQPPQTVEKVRREMVLPRYKEAQLQRIKELENKPELSRLFHSIAKPRTPEIDQKDVLGRTPIHRAVENNNLAEVKRLIEQEQATTTIKDNSGNTPYKLAVQEGCTEIAEYLLDK